MMKKFTVLAFAFATLAGLTGCQYLKGDPPAAPAPTAASAPQMVLVCDGKTKAVSPGTTIIKCGGQAAKPASRPASDNSGVIAELQRQNSLLAESLRTRPVHTPVAVTPAAGAPTTPVATTTPDVKIQHIAAVGKVYYTEKIRPALCVQQLAGGQFSNGLPVNWVVRNSKEECDAWDKEQEGRRALPASN